MQPPGWYHGEGDPPGTVRWWDGSNWVGGPQQQGAQQQAGYVAPNQATLPTGQALADPWLRIAAKLIDFIVLLIAFVIVFLATTFSVGFDTVLNALVGGNGDIGLLPNLASALVGAAYYGGMNTFFSGTVGKLVLGMRIVQKDGTEPLGIPVGLIRSGVHFVGILGVIPFGVDVGVSIVVLIVGLVSLVFLFTDPQHRTLMDQVAKTYVIKKP